MTYFKALLHISPYILTKTTHCNNKLTLQWLNGNCRMTSHMHSASHSRTPEPSAIPLREPQISQVKTCQTTRALHFCNTPYFSMYSSLSGHIYQRSPQLGCYMFRPQLSILLKTLLILIESTEHITIILKTYSNNTYNGNELNAFD